MTGAMIGRRSKARSWLALMVGAALALPSSAAADDVETFTVNSGGDAGDGTCEAAAGECTLRDAMFAAADNDDTDVDTIAFDASVTGTIAVTGSQLPVIEDPLNVNGPGAGVLTISGLDTPIPSPSFKIFEMNGAANAVTIAGLTLDFGAGGGPAEGGAIDNNSAQVTLDDLLITRSGPIGIFNGGTLTVTDSQVSGNAGRGVVCDGTTTTSVIRSVVSDNENFSNFTGGGIACGGVVTIDDSTISGNDTAEEGAGLFATGGSTVTIEGSTIKDNISLDVGMNRDGRGGGISAFSSDLTIRNSTISGNTARENPGDGDSAPGGFGGGIYSYFFTTTKIYGSTIADNTADAQGGGMQVEGAGPHTLVNTIVADNAAPAGPDLFTGGATADLSFSLIENASGATINHAVPGSNLTGVDPQLGALAMNGGLTLTHRPSNSSPALDQGSTALTTDQRGNPREADLLAIPNSMAVGADASDMGAVELATAEGPAPPQPQPTPLPLAPAQRPAFDIAAALKRCRKKYEKGTKARKRCIQKARQRAA